MSNFSILKSVRRCAKVGRSFGTLFLVLATIVWSLGIPLGLLVPNVAMAASAITVSTQGLPTEQPGQFVMPSMPWSMPILKISIMTSQAGQTLTSARIDFSGTNFTSSDLAAIAQDETSGVSLWEDTNGDGMFNPGGPGSDTVIGLAANPDWIQSTNNIILTPATPVSLPNAVTKVFFVAIKTSGTISQGDRIIATVPQNGVVTSDGSGPAAAFSSNYLVADTTPAQIAQINSFVGSTEIEVFFTRPVKKNPQGAIVFGDNPFTYTDGGGIAQIISDLHCGPSSQQPDYNCEGRDRFILVMDTPLDLEDFSPTTPATLAVGQNKIADMGGPILDHTRIVNFSSPPNITTNSIPSTAVGNQHTTQNPLVTFAAQGGTSPYTWSPNTIGPAPSDQATLTALGLSLEANTGKLYGTVASTPGVFNFSIKVTDSSNPQNTFNRQFTLNVASQSGGGIPGISQVNPGAGAPSTSFSMSIVGTNTNFTSSSVIEFLLNGANDSNLAVTGLAVPNSTTLNFNLAIGPTAATGVRNIRITTGQEVVTRLSGVDVFTGGASGLTPLSPADAATGVQLPPFFNFNASSNVNVQSYRVTVNTASNFSGTTLWDYIFPAFSVDSGSHCSSSDNCNAGYGEGRFRVPTQAAMLQPNNPYYWKVRTYTQTPINVDITAQPTESTPVRSFTSVSTLTDTMPPSFMFRPAMRAAANTDLNLIARVMDNLATSTSSPALSAQIYYCAGSGCNPTTTASAVHLNAGFFRFTIPGATIGAANTIVRYYLSASDGANTATDKAPGDVPYELTSVTAGVSTISGQVLLSGSTCPAGVQGATVFASGIGSYATTDNQCAFTLTGLWPGTYDLSAARSGYGEGMMQGMPAGSNNVVFLLGQGQEGGQSGDQNRPRLMQNGPPLDSMVPANDSTFKVWLRFDREMGEGSVLASGAITINEVNSVGGLTDITTSKGSLAYYRSGHSAGSNVAEWTFSQSACGGPCTFGENKNFVVKIAPTVVSANGNPIMNNEPSGYFSYRFFTGTAAAGNQNNFTDFASGGNGQYAPPFVTSSAPSNGSQSVSTNARLTVNFSQPVSSTGIDSANSQGTCLKLYDTVADTYVTVQSIAVDPTTRSSATITVGGNGLAANHSFYEMQVLGCVRGTNGMTMADPNNQNQVMYRVNFRTSGTADSSAPAVLGTSLGSYPAATSCPAGVDLCVTGVPTNESVIDVSFSKDMDASTISTSTVSLSASQTLYSVSTNNRTIRIFLETAMSNLVQHTLTISTGVKAMNGVALASAYTVLFTTSGTTDTTAPGISFSNADDARIAISFTEPMNAAQATDTTNWASSVLNPANYILFTDDNPPPTGQYALYFNQANLAASVDAGTGGPLTFSYDPAYNTVTIEGLRLLAGAVTGGFRIGVNTTVKDLSGNLLTGNWPFDGTNFGANTVGGGVMSSAESFGNIGPGMGGMAGPPPAAALSGGVIPVTMTGGFDPLKMGYMPTGVSPMNMMTGQKSLYGMDLLLLQALPAGGQIVLTFPVGFDVTDARDADPNARGPHMDINGPGAGTVTIASMTANATARTVTVTLGAVGTQANDFIHLEIDQIKNASTANTMSEGNMGSGYTIDIFTKTPTAQGSRTVEAFNSPPFFLRQGGVATNTLTGTINVLDALGAPASITGTIEVFLGSPMTGPQKQRVSFNNQSSKTYTFSNLLTGHYMLGTDPVLTVGATDYYVSLYPMPRDFDVVTGANTLNFNYQVMDQALKPGVTVNITGTFVAQEVDIPAGGPNGFAVKTVTLNGTYTNANPYTATLYLPSTGTYMVGMGPAMPRGMDMAFVPEQTNWMPPQPKQVTVSGTPGNWVWNDQSGVAQGDLANDGKISIPVRTANIRSITGYVYGPTGTTGIQNANVFAHATGADMGMPGYAKTAADGSFNLNLPDGSYKIGVDFPGMPPSSKRSLEVKTVGQTTSIYLDGQLAASVILRVKNPETGMRSISGTLTNAVTNGNVVKDASIRARRTDAPGNVAAKTDSAGNYIIYVPANSTWQVGAYLPGKGELPEQTVVITTSSAVDKNFAPASTTTYFTVSDRVFEDVDGSDTWTPGDTAIANAHVDFMDSNGNHNSVITDVNGVYSTNLAAGTYTQTAWNPSVGEMPSQSVAVTGNINQTGAADMPAPDLKTVTVNFIDSQGPVTLDNVSAQMDKLASVGIANNESRENVSSLTLQVPGPVAGGYEYVLDVEIPGIKDDALTVSSTTQNVITEHNIDISDAGIEMYQVKVEQDLTVNVTVPNLYALSGQALDDSGNPLPNTTVNIKQANVPEVTLAVATDENGDYSVRLPASGNNPYILQVDKAGYMDTGEQVAVAGNTTKNLEAPKATRNISGLITVNGTAVEGAQVLATGLGGQFAATETGPDGTYTLPVIQGDVKITAVADGYQEKAYENSSSQPIVVSTTSANQTGINLDITTAQTGLAAIKSSDATPSMGATHENSDAGLEVKAPQNAIAASQSSHQMQSYEVSATNKTTTAMPIGNEGIEVMVQEPSGSTMIPKQKFLGDISVEKTIPIATLTAEHFRTFTEVEAIKMSYYSESDSQYQPLSTNIAYLGTGANADTKVIPDATLSNVGGVVIRTKSNHFTVFAATNPSPDGLAPAAPTSVTATGASTGVNLTWTAPTLNADSSTLTDLLGYEVYRSTSASGTYVQINTSDVLTASYSDTTAASGTTYYYKITAADTGGIESALSSASNGAAKSGGAPGSSPSIGTPSVPSAPSSLQATASSTGISLTWSAASGASSYKVYRRLGSSGSWVSVGTPTSLSYSDTTVAANTTYTYKVVGVNSAGEGVDSSIVSVVTLVAITPTETPAPTTPATPTTPAETPAPGETPSVAPAPIAAPAPAITQTPSAPGVAVESLRAGTFAYNAARVKSLPTEQGLAKRIAGHLDDVLPGVFNRLFHLMTAKSKQWWYTYVNAYVYGGYTLEEIRQSVRFGGKTVHPAIPASAWRSAKDYKDYIDRE